ncbi:MAG: hypothetical protein NDJ90_05970 [Oligoflexia bacterium]|nr:hypothetical protein [Oligoflexia bacterium]
MKRGRIGKIELRDGEATPTVAPAAPAFSRKIEFQPPAAPKLRLVTDEQEPQGPKPAIEAAPASSTGPLDGQLTDDKVPPQWGERLPEWLRYVRPAARALLALSMIYLGLQGVFRLIGAVGRYRAAVTAPEYGAATARSYEVSRFYGGIAMVALCSFCFRARIGFKKREGELELELIDAIEREDLSRMKSLETALQVKRLQIHAVELGFALGLVLGILGFDPFPLTDRPALVGINGFVFATLFLWVAGHAFWWARSGSGRSFWRRWRSP